MAKAEKQIDALMDRLMARPGKTISLKDYDSSYTAKIKDKKLAETLLQRGVDALAKQQDMLYAQDTWALLVIFQAMDAAGKDGTIKHVMSGVNPQGCQVFSFKAPSAEERDHDYLWRSMNALPEVRRGFLVFIDDNIAGNRRYARELFTRLKPLKKKWASQASMTVTRDPELLKLAAESGCVTLFIGVESLSPENLKDLNKTFNHVYQFEEAMKAVHDHDIMVVAGLIFGLDHDDEGVFEKTLRFCERNRIELPSFFLLTPLPGTQLFQRMESEGRLLHKDWAQYNGATVVFKPRLMTEETLQRGFNWACKEAIPGAPYLSGFSIRNNDSSLGLLRAQAEQAVDGQGHEQGGEQDEHDLGRTPRRMRLKSLAVTGLWLMFPTRACRVRGGCDIAQGVRRRAFPCRRISRFTIICNIYAIDVSGILNLAVASAQQKKRPSRSRIFSENHAFGGGIGYPMRLSGVQVASRHGAERVTPRDTRGAQNSRC